MTVSALAAVSGVSGPRPAQRFDPAYALAYRFTVQIQGLDIGRWQSCSGLKVDFKPAEIKAGGRYDSMRYLAGEVAYPKVVLKRAIVASQSSSLQMWLGQTAQAWLKGEAPTGSLATITLYDSYGAKVMTWTLANARPSAWSGPDLDANSSKVALETLELVHEGFVIGPGDQAQAESNAEQGALKLSDGSSEVAFLYPPTEIQVQKSQQPTTTVDKSILNVDNQPSESGGQQVAMTRNKGNTTSYVLNNLVLEGSKTRDDVQRLTAWATRVKTKTEGDPKKSPVMPDITFSWGDGFNAVPVRLMSLGVTYTRFTPTGVPSRAKVNLKLDERQAPAQVPAGASNPTSGGIPGRAAHVLLASDSLHALAQETYGSAGRWRDIAAANAVEDPFRVAPGTTLFLPARSELDAAHPARSGEPR